MIRNAGTLLLIFMAGGCLSVNSGPQTAGGFHSKFGQGYRKPTVPGVVGPHGQPVGMAAPYNAGPPMGERAAMAMLTNSMPMNMLHSSPGGPLPTNMPMPGGAKPPMMMTPRGGLLSPPGVPFAPGVGKHNPIQQTQFAQRMPPPAMPSPEYRGMPGMPAPRMTPPLGVAAVGANIGQHSPTPFSVNRTQVRFVEPVGMKISWFTQTPDGKPSWSPLPIETPGRYNFSQAAYYRLKLTNIKWYPNMPPIYPTLEVVPTNVNTATFLAHSSVPVQFTKEDFDQVVRGNYLVKVIYLPYPQFQELAGAGPDEILSTQLEPGVDPIKEAARRGSILLVIRMGSIDQEAPNTPPINAPGPQQRQMVPPQMMPRIPGRPGPMVPYFGLPPGVPLVGPDGKQFPPPHMGRPPAGMPPNMGQPPQGFRPPMPAPVPQGNGPQGPANVQVPQGNGPQGPANVRPNNARPPLPPIPPKPGSAAPAAPTSNSPVLPGISQATDLPAPPATPAELVTQEK